MGGNGLKKSFSFRLLGKDPDSSARLGEVNTGHGVIPTPVFMPVATHGFMRALRIEEVEASGAPIVLANIYHLLVRPGPDRIQALGGLHRFMGWSRSLLTDSGGFQITSLPDKRTVTDDGIRFKSHVDGSLLVLDPEKAMDLQAGLGVDIAMVLDECTPHPYTRTQLEAGLSRTLGWAERALKRGLEPGQALFAITQGGTESDLRTRAARELGSMPFQGYAIGGLGIGEGREALHRMVANHTPELPEDRPRYLMGVGPPQDILEAVCAGVDMFDCVIPTRHGRNGGVFTSQGPLNIRNARHRSDPSPLDRACPCPVCVRHSRGYLSHVFKSGDSLGGTLLTLHNMFFFQRLMEDVRRSIRDGTLQRFRDRIHAAYPARESGKRPRPNTD